MAASICEELVPEDYKEEKGEEFHGEPEEPEQEQEQTSDQNHLTLEEIPEADQHPLTLDEVPEADRAWSSFAYQESTQESSWTVLQHAKESLRIFSSQGPNVGVELEELEFHRPQPPPATNPVYYFYNPQMATHVWEGNSKDWGADGEPHPEDPRRLETIINCLDRSGLLGRMEEVRTDHLLEQWEAELAHGKEMWGKLEKYSKMSDKDMKKWNSPTGGGEELSLYAHPTSFLVTRIGGGGVLALLKKIQAVGGSAMAVTRPPCNDC